MKLSVKAKVLIVQLVLAAAAVASYLPNGSRVIGT